MTGNEVLGIIVLGMVFAVILWFVAKSVLFRFYKYRKGTIYIEQTHLSEEDVGMADDWGDSFQIIHRTPYAKRTIWSSYYLVDQEDLRQEQNVCEIIFEVYAYTVINKIKNINISEVIIDDFDCTLKTYIKHRGKTIASIKHRDAETCASKHQIARSIKEQIKNIHKIDKYKSKYKNTINIIKLIDIK